MTCTILGPGLVGSFLGAAAGAGRVICGRRGHPTAFQAHLPADPPGRRTVWHPEVVDAVEMGPLLVCTRVSATPWDRLPADALLAQNGLGQPRACLACFFAVDRDDQGVVGAVGPQPRIVLEDPGPTWAPALAAWRRAGIAVEVVADVMPARWEKCILNATVGPLCLATGRGMAAVWDDPTLRALVRAATVEGIALAAGAGVHCDAQFLERTDAFFAACDRHRPSVVTDPGELPWVLGALLDRADAQDRACPALHRIATMVALSGTGDIVTRLPRTG